VIRQLSLAVLLALACARITTAQPAERREPDPTAAGVQTADTSTTSASKDKEKDKSKHKDKDKDKDKDKKKADNADGDTIAPADSDKKGDKKKEAEASAPPTSAATESSATASSADAAAAQAAKERDDAVLDRAQPDFTLVNLQTSLRLPKFKSAFRVTHRFTRALGQGDFGDLLSDFFGFDSGALIGLEYRFGLLPGLQGGILRTSDKTIQFFSQYEVKGQSASFPVGLAALAMIDGTNNFRDSYSPALGLIVSRTVGTRLALYAQPIWVNNSNQLPSELADENDTVLLGIGARVRVGGSTYLVGEFVPRVAGYDPGAHGGSFGIEKRAGGHAFQMNFSNTFGTTIGQIARGGVSSDDWYIGFNISRKFY
jgi:hypothetical protein